MSLGPSFSLDSNAFAGVLAEAATQLGRLDGLGELSVAADSIDRSLVLMSVRREAVLSSRIEGTQASLSDLLELDADPDGEELSPPKDARDVSNYVRAMWDGVESVRESGAIDLSLVMRSHATLLERTRGERLNPGALRTTQNWITVEGQTAGVLLEDALFVPPPAETVPGLMANLIDYVSSLDSKSALVGAGVAHAQFETIHPFLDGNGRIGRMLIGIVFVRAGLLARPLLNISEPLSERKDEYYKLLMRVRERGTWEEWIAFYLECVRDAADAMIRRFQSASRLVHEHRAAVDFALPNNPRAARLLRGLLDTPVVNGETAARIAEATAPTTYALLEQFERLGIVREVTGRKRNKWWMYEPWVNLISK